MEAETQGKVIGAASRLHRTESRYFTEFRTVGNVSTGVPCFLRYIHRRKENFIVTCAGKTFNTYASQNLKLVSSGGSAYEYISCMTGDTYHVYTGVGSEIHAWRRGTELKHTYRGHEDNVKLLLAFGKLLVSIDVLGELKVWNISSEKVIRTAKFIVNKFSPTVLMHPLTFENKIILGSSQGLVQIWNLNTGQMVHQFSHWKNKKIHDIVQAPGRGVVAIALSSKQIALFNFEFDVILFNLTSVDEPRTIAFRTDEIPVLMAGSSIGSITAWDLEKKEVIAYEQDAHQKAVTGLVSFMNESIFVSSSPDNSVKVWIFDKPDGGFRLLNSRDGHRLPPSLVQFHGDGDMNIITAGEDKCLRSFHIYNETLNRTINNYVAVCKKGIKRQGVPISHFATANCKNANWEDIACFNKSNGREVNTFSMVNTSRGENLKFSKFTKMEVSTVCVSNCNNYVIVGFQTGEVLAGSMQSKILRKTFGTDGIAHSLEVTGLAINDLNSIMASGSLDKTIKFWDFKGVNLILTIVCKWSIETIVSPRNKSSLFAVVTSNFKILLFDFKTLKLMGKLKGSSHPIVSCAFKPDCNWLTAASADGLIRTWYVPARSLVDIFGLFNTLITSLAYSPNGEFLATTLSGELGVILWMNRTVYEHVSVMTLPLNFNPISKAGKPIKITNRIVDEEIINDYDFATADDMMENFIVFVNRKSSRWKNLLKLSDIALRNKPKNPVRQEMAPFMLSHIGVNIEPDAEKKRPDKSALKLVIETKTSPDIFESNGIYSEKKRSDVSESNEMVSGNTRSKVKNSKKKRVKFSNDTCPATESSSVAMSRFEDLLSSIEDLEKENTETLEPRSSKLVQSMVIAWSPFAQKLSLGLETVKHYEELLALLESMGPSRVDMEIRQLGPENGGSIELLSKFLAFIRFKVNDNGHFQSVQAFLGLFLKIYAGILPSHPSLVDGLNKVFPLIEETQNRLTNRVNAICALTDFAKSDLL